MKILCVLLPHFSINCEVSRKPALARQPFIITQVEGSQKIVLDFSPELQHLQPGMPLQQAMAIQGSASLVQADLPYYWSIFDRILDALETKCPLVEGYDLGQAYLGMDGMQLLYADQASLLKNLNAVLPANFVPRMGLAGGKFPAYLAALHSSTGECLTLTANIEAFLKDLPCDVLPVSQKCKDKLLNFGMRTLGQLLSLPAGPLQSQFGPEGKLIYELVRGRDSTPLYPRFMEENIDESTVLSSVTVSLEAIILTLEVLLARVFARDELKGRGIRRINVWTRDWSSQYWEHTIQYKEPAMNVKAVMARIKQVLEGFPQSGPVEQIGLKITGLGYLSGRQKSLFADVRARERLIQDIKQLEFRLGSPQIFQIKEVEPWSRIPERRYVLAPISQ